MKIPYRYLELNISSPMFVFAVEDEWEGELFLNYIKKKKVSQHIKIERATAWGWFKFSEVINIEWFNEYNIYKYRKQQELIKANNSGKQTALF